MLMMFRAITLLGMFLSLVGGLAVKDDQEGRRHIMMELVTGSLFLLSMIIQ